MTREDVLREFAAGNDQNYFEGWRTFDMADEIVRLRERVEKVRELATSYRSVPSIYLLAALGGDDE